MEPKEKKAFEPSGLVPRSIVRTFERFRQQLLPGSETAAIREYRISRYQVLVSVRCLFTLLIIPIATNWLVSSWLLSPLVEHFWNTQQNEIFLNSYQEERAFAELESFSEKLFFESLLNTTNTINVDFTPLTPTGSTQAKSSRYPSGVSNSCDRNPIPHANLANRRFSLRAGVHFSGDSVASEQDKFSICKIWVAERRNQAINDAVIKSVPIDDYVNSLQILQIEDLHHLHHLLTPYPERVKGYAVPVFYKSSICGARVNSPFNNNKFSKAWYSSIFYPRKTSVAELRTEELAQRERDFLPTKMNPYPLPLRGIGDCRAKLCIPPTKMNPTGSRVHFSRGYIEDLQAVRVNNGVKALSTKAKDPFLLSVPIENTYDNSLKIKEKVQNKILELAIYYNQQTIISITNIVGDVVSLITLGCLFIWMKPEITILKSFLIEAIYSLSDTTKSFLLILLTDLLVGFHSPRGWETALELLLKHFGLPENQDFVFLFVATFPVLLDTVFKYWIFRHLNKISPSTVATYHSMIE